MRVVEIIRRPTDAERRRLIDFVEHTTRTLGARPLSDHLWLDLNTGRTDGFIAATVSDEAGTVAMAQISTTNDSASLEVVIDPGLTDPRPVRDDVVETAVDSFRHHGGGMLYWWVDDPDASELALAGRIGLRPGRELLEMRRSLPLETRATVATRSFVVGHDEDAWIAVNNRAFADHGEQGGWTADMLASRIAEPWFDPDGFRLHERDGRLAGFCWTKLHAEHDPVTGEIYVIAVDPDFHGQGLGKQLTLAGLDSIAAGGITTAMLYVDAANATAVRMYEQLGFTIHRSRQAFAGDLSNDDLPTDSTRSSTTPSTQRTP
jgi:mycothiol synthase